MSFIVTLKRDLLKLNSENDKIFSQTKRVKGTETKEKVNLCVYLRADKLTKEASLLHNDPKTASLCNDDLIAKEAA